MDWPEFFKQLTGFVTAIGILVTIAMQAWAKVAATRDAAKLKATTERVAEDLKAHTTEAARELAVVTVAQQAQASADLGVKVDQMKHAANGMTTALADANLRLGTALGHTAGLKEARDEASGKTP